MSVALFDFTNLIIKAQDFNPMDASSDIYSEWKRQLLTHANPALAAGAPPAFDVSVGGNPVNATQTISPYFFIRNDLGWRLEPAAGSGELEIAGNLFPFDVNTAYVQADSGGGTVLVRQLVSPQSLTNTTSDVTAFQTQVEELVRLLKNKMVTNPVTGKLQLLSEVDDVTVLLEADLFEDVAETQPYRGRGAEVRGRLVAP